MTVFAYASAALFALLGMMHLVYTLRDFGPRPRSFVPQDRALLDAMRQTRTALAPDGRDYWSGILGFHLSHSIGVLLLAVLIIVATGYQIGWLKAGLMIVAAIYAAISARCWFRVPTAGILLAALLMGLGWSV
jgi:hypothetical protein